MVGNHNVAVIQGSISHRVNGVSVGFPQCDSLVVRNNYTDPITAGSREKHAVTDLAGIGVVLEPPGLLSRLAGRLREL